MRKFRTKNSNKRKLILNIFLFLFLLIGVGYSTVFTNLGINGNIVLLNYRDLNIKQISSTDRTAFRSDTYRENIKTITLNDSISAPSGVIESWDISETGNGGVMAYIVQNANDNTKYDLYIQGNGRLYSNKDSSYLFGGLTSLETINNLNKLTTTKTTNMSNMFNGDTNLAIIDLSNFNMSKVTNTTDMLNGTTSLINLTTPKTYPTDSNVTITLPTSLYDTGNTEYQTLNNTSPTETFIKDDDRYLITFDHNGGNSPITQKVVTYGQQLPSITVPTRNEYTFFGYNDNINSFDMTYNKEIQIYANSSQNRIKFEGIDNTWTMTKEGDKNSHINGKIIVNSEITGVEFNDVVLDNDMYNIVHEGTNYILTLDFDITEYMVTNNTYNYETNYRFIDLSLVDSSADINVLYIVKDGNKYYDNSGNGTVTYNKNENITLYAQWKKNYTITNLISNGSFENGKTGWINWYPELDDIVVSTDVAKYGTHSIKNAGNKKWQTTYNPFNGIPNHKYYYSNYEYGDSTSCYSHFGFYYDNTNHWETSVHQERINVWEKQSGLDTGPNNEYQVRYIVVDSSAEDGVSRTCYSDGVLVVDLTATFGAGNEPSKIWCDRNIEYFDGTTTVYK